MERKNLIGSAIMVIGRSGLFNRAASRRGIRLAPLLLVAVLLAAVAVLAVTSNPAQTVHAHDTDPPRDHEHPNVVCTVPPAVSCSYADVPAERTLLSTTMTVGHDVETGPQSSFERTGFLSGQGSLGVKQFSYRETNSIPSEVFTSSSRGYSQRTQSTQRDWCSR